MPQFSRKKKTVVFWSYISILLIVASIAFLRVYEKHEVIAYNSAGFPTEIASWNLLTHKKKVEVLDGDGGIAFYYFLMDSPKNGVYEEYSPNGVLRYRCTYVNDSLNGPSFEYYASGNRKSYIYYQHGLPDNSTYSWFENGEMAMKGSYHLGKLEGRLIHYFPNGSVFADGYYQGGKEVGNHIFFDSIGRVTDTMVFDN